MTIQVTQCENCPFCIVYPSGDETIYCDAIEKVVDTSNGIPEHCPLITSDITVTLKQ